MPFVPLFAMPPPYFPARSLAVMLLLAAVATVPPLAIHSFRRRGPYTGWQKLLAAAVGLLIPSAAAWRWRKPRCVHTFFARLQC